MISRAEDGVQPISDRCPYSRPFPADFDGCSAFSPRDFTALDLRYKPLRTVVTCRHLVAGKLPSGGYYGRCALGDEAARRRWVARVGSGRLDRIRAIGAGYRTWAASRMPELWALKGTWLELRELNDQARSEAAAADLRKRVENLIMEASDWVDARSSQLAEAGLPPEALKELIANATEDWARSSSPVSGYRIPDELLGRFPTAVQVFFTVTRP